jgi:hypothetical protein
MASDLQQHLSSGASIVLWTYLFESTAPGIMSTGKATVTLQVCCQCSCYVLSQAIHAEVVGDKPPTFEELRDMLYRKWPGQLFGSAITTLTYMGSSTTKAVAALKQKKDRQHLASASVMQRMMLTHFRGVASPGDYFALPTIVFNNIPQQALRMSLTSASHGGIANALPNAGPRISIAAASQATAQLLDRQGAGNSQRLMSDDDDLEIGGAPVPEDMGMCPDANSDTDELLTSMTVFRVPHLKPASLKRFGVEHCFCGLVDSQLMYVMCRYSMLLRCSAFAHCLESLNFVRHPFKAKQMP